VRTTVNISDATLAEIRAIAAESGRPFRKVLEETLQRGLAATKQRRRRVEISPARIGIKPGFRGMSMNQLFDQLEADDSER